MRKKNLLIVITFILASHCVCFAQWVPFNNPTNNEGLTSHNNYLFVSGGNGVFRSSDNAKTWEQVINGLHGNTNPPDSRWLYTFGDYLFAEVIDWDIYRSNNDGQNWSRPKIKITTRTLTSKDTSLFCCWYSHVLRSSDSANTWDVIDSGLPRRVDGLSVLASGVTVIGNLLFCSNSAGQIYSSSNNGDNWSLVYDRIKGQNMRLYSINDSILIATSGDSVYRSVDSAKHWFIVDTGFYTNTFIANENKFFLGGYPGVKLSTDYGVTWKSTNDAVLDSGVVSDFTIHKGYLYASAWRRPLSDFASVPEQPQTPTLPSLKITISESGDHFTVQYYTERDIERPKFEIFDILGRLITSSVEGYAQKGWNTITIPINKLTSGTYICRVSGSGYTQSRTMQISW